MPENGWPGAVLGAHSTGALRVTPRAATTRDGHDEPRKEEPVHDRSNSRSGRDVRASDALLLHRTSDRTLDRPEQRGRLLRPSST